MLRRERIDDWAAKHVDAERNETKRTKGETSGNQQSRNMLGLRPLPNTTYFSHVSWLRPIGPRA